MKLIKFIDYRGAIVCVNPDHIIMIDEGYYLDKETNIGVHRSRLFLTGRRYVIVNRNLDEVMEMLADTDTEKTK